MRPQQSSKPDIKDFTKKVKQCHSLSLNCFCSGNYRVFFHKIMLHVLFLNELIGITKFYLM